MTTNTKTTLMAEDVSRATGLRLYGQRYCSSLADLAEMELDGRSHYYDAQTRRYFGCRVLHLEPRADGLILTTVESVSHPTEGRLYRAVAFDLSGTVIHRSGDATDSHGFKTSRAAYKELASLAFDVAAESARIMTEETKRAERKLSELQSV